MGRLLCLRTGPSMWASHGMERMQGEHLSVSPVRAFWSGGSEAKMMENCAIRVENVTFRYPGSSKKVSMYLVEKKGTVVAIFHKVHVQVLVDRTRAKTNAMYIDFRSGVSRS